MIILYMCWIIYILSWIDPSICKQIFPFRHNPYEYFFRGYMLRIIYIDTSMEKNLFRLNNFVKNSFIHLTAVAKLKNVCLKFLISLLGQEAACMVAQPAMVLEMQGAHFL